MFYRLDRIEDRVGTMLVIHRKRWVYVLELISCEMVRIESGSKWINHRIVGIVHRIQADGGMPQQWDEGDVTEVGLHLLRPHLTRHLDKFVRENEGSTQLVAYIRKVD